MLFKVDHVFSLMLKWYSIYYIYRDIEFENMQFWYLFEIIVAQLLSRKYIVVWRLYYFPNNILNFEQDFRNNRIKSWFTTFSFFHDHASHYKTSKQWFKQCDCPFTHHAIRFIHCSIFALSCKRLYNRRGIMCLQFANLAWIFCNSVSSFE